jgi:hypothetical protein
MRLFRSIVSLVFAFLVLVSSTSFMVGIHRCGGHVKDIALFDKAEGCANEQKVPPCHRLDTPVCCQDVTVIHEEEDFKGEIAQFEFFPSLIGDAVQSEVVLAEVIGLSSAASSGRPDGHLPRFPYLTYSRT